MDFVHHHVHSEFSALDGMPSAVEVTDCVVALGQRGFSTTDHGMMSGIPSMYREAKARDLLYSPGIEAYFAFDRTLKSPDSFNQKYYHLIFIAHNFEGYQNLSRMQRFAWEEGFYHKARVDMELIERFAGGFSVTTACLGSPVNQAFLRGDVEGAEKFTSDLVDILGKDNVYVELQDHGIPEDEIVIPRNLEMANRLGLKLLATNDSHYCSPEDAHDHEYLLCASTRSHINDPKRFKLETDQFYMKTGEEMAELFPPDDFPGAISNTIELAERSEFELPIGDKMTYLMPKFHIPDEYADEADMLRKLAYEGARDPARYGDGNGNISEAAKELIEYELSVIIGMNFPGYLLVVKRIIDLMRENDIGVGAGRGSAPSSALAYCLGITSLDPIKNNLLFWRFLNPDRISMPDIDIDIEKERRPEALKLLQEEFGADNVAQLANFNRMQTAAALERAVKASDFPPSMADLFKSKIAVFLENHDVSLKDALEASRNQKTPLGVAFAAEVADDAFSAMFTRAGSSQKRECSIELILSIAARFENKLMGYGVHACGLIITPGPVTDYFPVKTGKDLNVCQFDGSDAESMGAVKMDLLGIQSIDSCQKTERNIALDLGEKIDTSTLSPDDPKVYETLSSGDGKGVFQMGCLAGDVEIDGIAISALYAAQQNGLPVDELNSVCVNTGSVIRNQLKRVVHSGRKPCRSFLVANGSRITATDDHKFFTVDGWRRGGDLAVGDVVLTVTDRGRRVYSAPRKRSKKLIASLISELTGTQWVPTSQKVNLKGSTAELTATTRDGSSAVIVYRGDASAWAHIAGRYENVEVISELDLFELAATLPGGVKYLALPDDASWQPIVTVDDAGVKDTFDVMMAAPANNVIANGYVVHNSGGMRKLMKKVRPDRFEDLSALLALYRPGPLGMGTPNEFARRKNSGETEFDVIHEDAREILADSYGLCVVGRTMIWDAAAGKPVRIDSIGDRVEDGFYTIGIDDFGEPEVVRVNEWFSLGRRETYKMSVEGGLELIGTADHPVLTGSGWKRMADITGQDVVAIPAGSGPAGMVGLQSDVATANGYDGRLDYGLAEPYQGMTPQEASRYEKVYWSKVNYCVKPGTLEEVYDISLNSASHNFIANGIVVSNCIYQEHIMQIATKFAGYTGGEADNLRKAMGKKIKSMMDAHQEKFTVAVDERYPDPVTYRNGDGKEVTESLGHAWWNIMEPFSSYAFNLSHSAAYAVLSYRTAYLKTYYPAQFGAASIDVDLNGSDKDKKGIDAHIEWMRNRGVTVYSPDINYSVNRGITTKDTVTLPLNIVKGFGEKRVKAIVEEREANGKFESVVDAIARVRLNRGEIVSLGLAGAFESFGANRFAVVSRVDDLLQEANLRKTELSFTDSMFDLGEIEQSAGDAVDLLSQPAVVTVGDEEIHTDTASLRDIEKSILGLSVQPHPFSVYGTGLAQAAEAYGKNVFAADELAEDTTLADDEPVVVYGIAVQPEQKLSKKGNLYLRMTVETTEGDADVFVFPPKKEAPPEVSDGDPVIVIGSVKSGYREDDDRKVFGKKVVLPDRAGIKLADSSPFGIFEAKVLQGFPHATAVINLPASGEVVSYGVVTEVTNTPKGAVFTLTSGEESVRVMRRGGTIDEGGDLFAVVVGNMAEVNGKRIIDASKALIKKG